MPWPGVPRIWLLNITRPPFDDVRVRRAVNHAVDKEAFLATVYRGTGLKAFAPLTAVMLDDPALRQAYPFDPGKAKALLGEAGWQPGADGIRSKGGQRLELVLNAIEYGGGPDPTAQLIQSSLRDVGHRLKIKAQARPPWYEDNYRCATHGPVMFLRSTDPDGLYSLFHSSLVGGNFNWSCVKNPKLDQMLAEGRRESDPAKRRAIYLAIEKLALDEALARAAGRRAVGVGVPGHRPGDQVQLQRVPDAERHDRPPLGAMGRTRRRADAISPGVSSPWCRSSSGSPSPSSACCSSFPATP